MAVHPGALAMQSESEDADEVKELEGHEHSTWPIGVSSLLRSTDNALAETTLPKMALTKACPEPQHSANQRLMAESRGTSPK